MIISDGRKIKVYNGTATTIDSNKIVVVKGKRIVLASNANTDVTKYPLGYTLSSISAGNYGEVLLEGSIQNINTSSYSEGSILYLGTSGNITSTAPTPEIILASVSKSDSLSGAIYFKVFISSSGVVSGVPAGGNAGDILAKNSATDYDTVWIENYASSVKHIVKLGENINKGQAVYVSSANGTNMIVSKASNATEATSSKTMGLLAASGVTNDQVYVITEGLLAGLDTSTANAAGDPVWLGTNGNLIYGLANKPYAPAHLVFIGIVTRKQSNNGEIFVKVQNGFELKEIHDVDLYTTTPINGHILGYNGTLWVNKTIAGWLGYTPYDASNPSNYIDSSALTPYLTSAAAASTYATISSVNAKQNTLSLTTSGTSGAATLTGSTLNIPQYSSIYTKSLSTFTSTGTTTTQILTSVLIPANTFVAGDVLRVTARLRKTGTASSANFALGINTTLSPSGAVTFKTNSIAATIPSFGVLAHAVIVNATTNTQLPWPATNYGTNDIISVTAATAGAWQESPINWTIPQYIIFQSSLNSAADSFSLIFYMIEKL